MAFRLGVIGAGRIFQNRMLPAIQHTPGVELAAVLDPSAEALRAIASQAAAARLTSCEEEFFTQPIDGVYIATANALHASLAVLALRRGWGVLVEKPMASNVAEAEQMLHAAEVARRPAMVAYMSKYNEHNVAARRLASEGRIGELVSICGEFGFRFSADDWRLRRKTSGFGALSDLGVYVVSTVRDVFGEVPHAASAVGYPAGGPEYCDLFIYGQLRFRSGRTALIKTSFIDNSHGYTIIGTRGLIRAENTWAQNCSGQLAVRSASTYEEVSLPAVNPYEAELRAFVRACLGEPAPVELVFAGAFQDMRVLEALDRSAAQRGREIGLNP